MQITDTPKRISIAVNKANLTHDMIQKTGVFNLSVLIAGGAVQASSSTTASRAAANVDKFEGHADAMPRTRERPDLPARELPTPCSPARSWQTLGLRARTPSFIADVTEAAVLSDAPSMTYDYYFSHVKPKPQPAAEKKVGWVCKICGYVYEGEVLPARLHLPAVQARRGGL